VNKSIKSCIVIILTISIIASLAVGLLISQNSFTPPNGISDTPTTASTPINQTIVDMAGVSVTLTSNVQKIGTARPVFCEILLALGAKDKIYSTSPNLDSYPWLKQIYPGIVNLSAPFAIAGVNTEELLRNKPDVVFLLTGDKAIESIQTVGIPVIQFSIKNEAEIRQTITIIGTILGGQYAKNAENYLAYYSEKANITQTVSSQLMQENKPSVLVMYGVSPSLNVYGSNTAMDLYINWSGGRNAAAELSTAGTISMEQLLKWDPDVIVVSVDPSALNEIKSDSSWNQLKAVKNGAVYINPKGVWTWDSKSAEMPLEFIWLAKTLHPDLYLTLNPTAELQYFYSHFFTYNLTDDEVNRIISAQPPR
jgi:iron complex transport system substrate-binding protein